MLLLGGVAVAAGLEADRVDTAVDLGYAEDLVDLLRRVALREVDGLASEAGRLLQPMNPQSCRIRAPAWTVSPSRHSEARLNRVRR